MTKTDHLTDPDSGDMTSPRLSYNQRDDTAVQLMIRSRTIDLANKIKWKFFAAIAKIDIPCGPFWVASLAQEIPHNDNTLNSMDHCLPQSTTLPGFYK